MRFLTDAQLPPSFARWLDDRGHQATHVGAIGMVTASDTAVAARAAAMTRYW